MRFDANQIESIRNVNKDFPDVSDEPSWVIEALCEDWKAMYELIAELAKRLCEAPRSVRRIGGDRSPTSDAYDHLPCGKCPPCRAKALVEERK